MRGGDCDVLDVVIIVLVGVLGGVAVGLQSPIAGKMGERVGGLAGSFIIHIGGALLSGALLLLRGGEQIANWRSLSWYMLGAGGLGVVLYLTLSRTIPRLGATSALTLIIVGQLLTGVVIDRFGLFGIAAHPLDGGRLLAILLLLGGAYLMVRG
jgi:bacterial/archaeal transporter family-2 protein